jgi:hypothetical protein
MKCDRQSCMQPAQALLPAVEVRVEPLVAPASSPEARRGVCEPEPVTGVTGSHHGSPATPAPTPPVSPCQQQAQPTLGPQVEMAMLLAQAQLRLQAQLGNLKHARDHAGVLPSSYRPQTATTGVAAASATLAVTIRSSRLVIAGGLIGSTKSCRLL